MSLPARCIAALAALPVAACGYLKDRTNDLLDPFRVDVGIEFGLYADARATDFAAVGLGAKGTSAGNMVGLHGRHAVRYGTAAVALGPWIVGDRIDVEPAPLLGGASTWDRTYDIVPGQMVVLPQLGGEHAPDWSLERRGWRVADVGANATVGLLGIGIGFSPGEFVDLLLGLVGIDPAGDDVFGAGREAGAAAADPTSGTPARASPRSAR